jgi:hypothetical protein
MSVTLTELLSEITAKTRNSTSGALDNAKRVIALNRTLEDLQDYADWDFTKRTKTFDFIDGVTEYNLKDYVGCTCQDNDGSSSILDFKNPYDLRPVDEADKSLNFNESKSVRENIRRNRFNYEYSIDNELLVVGYPRQTSAQFHNCDSLTANGTVAASGDATNLTIDEVEYKEGSGALNFDVSAGTSLVITFTGINSKDLEELQNKSYLVLKAYLPTITNFTSIAVRWGSDASNYWEKTETLPAGNRDLETGWNTFAFKWGSATETGTPVVTAVDYLQITITFSGATTDTDFRLDDIRIGEGVEMEFEYYSLAMAKDTAGDYQLEFNPDALTATDVLLGASIPKNTVTAGAIHECFEMVGGKSERDRSDSYKKYELKKVDLLKRAGHRIRRASKILNFAR